MKRRPPPRCRSTIGAVRSACLLVTLAACYSPTAPQGAPCSTTLECPTGQSCYAGVCSTEPLDVDALPAIDPWAAIDGLVVRYPMDDAPAATGTVAASDPQAVGSCSEDGCPASVDGINGSGYRFSGKERAVIMRPSLLTAAPYTVSLWAWIDPEAPSYSFILAKPVDSVSNQNSFGFGLTNFQVTWETSDGSIVALIGPADFEPSDGWHHYALLWDGDRKRLWIDGEATTSQVTELIDSDLPFSLGSDVNVGVPEAQFVGRVDELRIYNRALAPVEIQGLATSSGL